jgi:endo-1,4-beta-xylanase
LLFCKSPT